VIVVVTGVAGSGKSSLIHGSVSGQDGVVSVDQTPSRARFDEGHRPLWVDQRRKGTVEHHVTGGNGMLARMRQDSVDVLLDRIPAPDPAVLGPARIALVLQGWRSLR
jgi:hypothetical protein